jgi:hypothetical protein
VCVCVCMCVCVCAFVCASRVVSGELLMFVKLVSASSHVEGPVSSPQFNCIQGQRVSDLLLGECFWVSLCVVFCCK